MSIRSNCGSAHSRGLLVTSPKIPGIIFGSNCRVTAMVSEFMDWSRREDLNAPSAVNDTAALALSYTGSCLKLYSLERAFTKSVMTLWGRSPRRPRCNFSLTLIAPFKVKGT